MNILRKVGRILYFKNSFNVDYLSQICLHSIITNEKLPVHFIPIFKIEKLAKIFEKIVKNYSTFIIKCNKTLYHRHKIALSNHWICHTKASQVGFLKNEILFLLSKLMQIHDCMNYENISAGL